MIYCYYRGDADDEDDDEIQFDTTGVISSMQKMFGKLT